jgi:hypothetical protein
MKIKKLLLPMAMLFCALFSGSVKADDLLSRWTFHHQIAGPYSAGYLAKLHLKKATTTDDIRVTLDDVGESQADWILTFNQSGNAVYTFYSWESYDNEGYYWDMGNISAGVYDVGFQCPGADSPSNGYQDCTISYEDSNNNVTGVNVQDASTSDDPYIFPGLDIGANTGTVDFMVSAHEI